MADFIDLVSSEDEVVEASAVIAGHFEARLSTSSRGSSSIASLTSTVAAGAEGRFAVSDCDGHKRTESTHVENHFEQDPSILTEDASRRGDITEDRDDSSGVTSFVTAPSTIARTNLSNGTADKAFQISFNGSEVDGEGETSVPISNTDDLRLRLSMTLDDAENPELAITPRRSKEEAVKRTPMTASALFSIGKRKSVGWALQRASVLAGGSDEEEELGHNHHANTRKNIGGGRRRSILGRNEVFLLPSDSDSENDDEDSILIRPVPTSPEIRQGNVKTWVATSPFSTPRVSPKKLQVEEDLNGDTGTTDEICRIMEQSDCTSNQHSAKKYLTESSLMTEDEDTSVPISQCSTADKAFQISFNGSEVDADGETSVPISTTDTIDKALQISLGSDYDSSPAVVSRKAKAVKKQPALAEPPLSTISSSSENENGPEGNENDGGGWAGSCGSGLPPPSSLYPSTSSYRTAAAASSDDHSEEQVRRSARKPPTKEVGKLKGYFQRLKEEQERKRMKHEAKRKGDAVLDFGIRKLDSIPDNESDNDGSSDSSDKSAEDSPERGGADAVPRKLQFSPSERDDDDGGGERRKKKRAMSASEGKEGKKGEEEVEDDDSYDSSFIDDNETRSESESESSSASSEFLHDGDENNASPSNWRSTSPKPTPKTKTERKGAAAAGGGRARAPLSQLNGQQPPPMLLTFLQSLSLMQPNERCHPDAVKYIKQFPKHRDELARNLFDLFNEEAFAGGIQDGTEIVWMPRLRTTAGRCAQKKRRIGSSNEFERYSVIQLSPKVLDSPDRLRDTMVHEMCHAAAWIISGYADGHGPLFKDWARRAMAAFPELPIIARCHSYKIRTKYTYRCTKCGYEFGRHSKSLDMESKVCGKCRGRFELLVNLKSSAASATPGRRLDQRTPRAPSAFAVFVKDNYGAHRTPGRKHAEVMKELGAKFSAAKISAK